MSNEELKLIISTVAGYEVKDLRWLPLDNIITGLVKDPVWGKPDLYGGFIAGQWKRSGTPTNKLKTRTDLKLNIPNDEAKTNII